MRNAARALDRRASSGEVAVQYHFVAASTNHEAMDEFGIRNRLPFWLLGLGWRSLFAVVGGGFVAGAGRRHGCISGACWRAAAAWTSISGRRRWRRTCRCCWR